MGIVYILVNLAGGIYIATFALWLKKQKNIAGFVVMLSLACLVAGLPLINLLKK